MIRLAILDDYQGVALGVADWATLDGRAELVTFREPFPDEESARQALQEFDAVVAMRERTAFPASLLRRLPRLRLLVTTGRRNSAIDVAEARSLGVVVSGTESMGTPTAELTWALILGSSRHLVAESQSVAAGGWQTTLGTDLAGRTLGIVGLGRIGSQVAKVGTAFGMHVLAWSHNLTPTRAQEAGAELVALEELLGRSDVVTVHQVLSDRTRGLIGERELSLMRPTSLLVNTSRGPIVSTEALVAAVREGVIGGAAVDVFDQEPLPPDHPLRRTPGILATPHLGYVTAENYRLFYGQAVEDVAAFLDGEPLRVLDG